MRARMALAHANIKVELREILLSDRPKEIYDVSPKGTVPVLQLTDGTVIDESLDVMEWALGQIDTDWKDIDLGRQLAIIKMNDEDFKPILNKYKYHIRYPESSMDFYQKKCGKYLSQYESMLEGCSFLFGDKPQWADVAIMPLIRQFAHVDISYFESAFPNLNGWLEGWKGSELFKSIMKKYVQWQPNHSPLIVSFTS